MNLKGHIQPYLSSFYYFSYKNHTTLIFDCIILLLALWQFISGLFHGWTVSNGATSGSMLFYLNLFLFFSPAIDCPDDWWQLCGVGVSCHCLCFFFYFHHSLIILFILFYFIYMHFTNRLRVFLFFFFCHIMKILIRQQKTAYCPLYLAQYFRYFIYILYFKK